LTFRPTARDVGENRQNGNLVIIVPKEERIVPEQEETKAKHGAARRAGADPVKARSFDSAQLLRFGPLIQRILAPA
jgi:hypothetical protein